MSKPVIVSIPHSLGKAEARRRLEAGLGSVRSHFGSVLNVQEEVWSGDSLAFRASVLTQQTSGTITVAPMTAGAARTARRDSFGGILKSPW